MAVIEWDTAFRVTSWNPAAERIFGYSAEEAIGQHGRVIVPEAVRPLVDDIFRRLLDRTGGERSVNENLTRDGRTVICEWFNTPLMAADGRVIGVASIAQDVTERERSEAVLRQREERHRTVLRTAMDGYYLVDLTGRLLEVNDAYCRMSGYTESELLSMSIADLEAQEQPAETAGHIKKVMEEGQDRFETRHRRKDGSTCLMEASVQYQPVAGGQLVVFMRDITEKKAADEALLRSNERTRLFFERQLVGMAITAPDKGWMEVNDRLCQMLGYSREEFAGLTWADLTHPDDLESSDVQFQRVLAGEADGYSVEKRYIRKDGEVVFANLSVGCVRRDDGSVDYFLSLLGDLTERKRAEAEREKLQAQLLQAQKLESVGRLAGGVAHDFNNKLGIILGYAELAMSGLAPEDPRFADLQQVRSAAQQSAALTRQLLAFARKQIVAPRVLDLSATVEGMLGMLRRLIGEDIQLVLRPARVVWPVKMDPGQVDQVLANLCVNARDAIAGVGTVAIGLDNVSLDRAFCSAHPGLAPGEFVRLTVSDDGCGMDEETRAQIFEPFFTTKDVGQGTGLGLATVFGIVNQNRGAIDVESEPGKGTTFRIYFPRDEEAALAAREGEEQRASRGRGETLMVVEDEPANLALLQRVLEKLGYVVLAASGAMEASQLAAAHEGEISLLITDVIMPEMNGRQLAQHLRLSRPNLQCLYMSGYPADILASQGVLDDGLHFIQKPLSTIELAKKVRELLDGAR